MVHKNRQVPKLSDTSWIIDLGFLVNITAHLNTVNGKLQSRDIIIIMEASDLIRALEVKLQLWASQLALGQCKHFEHLTYKNKL